MSTGFAPSRPSYPIFRADRQRRHYQGAGGLVTTSFADTFDAANQPLNGYNGWSTPEAWQVLDGYAQLRGGGAGLDGNGYGLALRSDGLSTAQRHSVSALVQSGGSFSGIKEGLLWGYTGGAYWYAVWFPNTTLTGPVVVGRYVGGVNSTVVTSAFTFTLGVSLAVTHDFLTGALTVNGTDLNTGTPVAIYSGTQVQAPIAAAKLGMLAIPDGGGAFGQRSILEGFSYTAQGIA